MALIKMSNAGKIGLPLFIVGSVSFLIGFSVPNWAVVDSSSDRTGLWEVCRASCESVLTSKYNFFKGNVLEGWFCGVQALACLALITLIANMAVWFLFLCGKPKKLCVFSVVLDFMISLFTFVAAGMFGTKVDGYANLSVSWGFALNIIGGVVFVGVGICFIVEYIRLS